MSPNGQTRTRLSAWPLWLCIAAGLLVFHFWGNVTRGYIDSASLFVWWGHQWLDPRSELQHAWVLLGLSLFLFLRGLREESGYNESSGPDTWQCAGALAGALALHALGLWLQQPRLSVLALLLFLWGLACAAGGRRWSAAATFPLVLMLFALPAGFFDIAGFWLRLSVVEASQSLLSLGGIKVLRSGTQLFDPSGAFQYDVVAACSGVRSLQALLALSLVLGYLRFRALSGRMLSVLLTLPWVYVANVLRIVAIVLAGKFGGAAAGERVHSWSGVFVFVVVLSLVFASVAVVSKIRPGWLWEAAPRRFTDGRRVVLSPWLGIAMLACAVLLGTFHTWLERSMREIPSGLRLSADGRNPVELPAFVGTSWVGRQLEPTAVERELLPADTGYSRRLYHSLEKTGRKVFVSVVLSGRDRSSIHRPELCLVGQGWSIEKTETSVLSLGFKGISASVLHVRRHFPDGRPGKPELVAYFFVGREQTVPTQAAMQWRDVLDRILGKPQRWAYVLVQTALEGSEKEAIADMEQVLAAGLPALLVSDPAR